MYNNTRRLAVVSRQRHCSARLVGCGGGGGGETVTDRFIAGTARKNTSR